MPRTTTHALEVTELNLPLITVLNGGVTPQFELETTYFVFEVDGPESTGNHRILTSEEFADIGGYDGKMLSIHHLS